MGSSGITVDKYRHYKNIWSALAMKCWKIHNKFTAIIYAAYPTCNFINHRDNNVSHTMMCVLKLLLLKLTETQKMCNCTKNLGHSPIFVTLHSAIVGKVQQATRNNFLHCPIQHAIQDEYVKTVKYIFVLLHGRQLTTDRYLQYEKFG